MKASNGNISEDLQSEIEYNRLDLSNGILISKVIDTSITIKFITSNNELFSGEIPLNTESKNSLTSRDSISISIIDNTAEFIWFLCSQGLKIKLGNAILTKETLFTFVDEIIKEFIKNKKDLIIIKKNEKEIQSKLDEIMIKFNRFVKEKQENEWVLYKRFVDLLNEKKKKIRELKQ